MSLGSKKLKITLPWTHVIDDLNVKELLECFMKKNCIIQIQ